MNYSKEIQSTIDIDWFAIDKNGLIAHFASGGGALPDAISASKNETDLLAAYFRERSLKQDKVFVNNSLSEFVEFNSREEEDRYLRDFITMGKRGFYSFDKTYPGNFMNRDYHLVVTPEEALELDELPVEIRRIVSKVKITQDLRSVNAFTLSENGMELIPILIK